ncbi:hypothetical protein Ndes2437B_g06914 [Nannochloris sp. 'desiccata']|nr:hypothetical protein KSW81_005269 [Chlorella desiccata (nom. nud.)]
MAGEAIQQCRTSLKKLKEISSSGTKGLADPELRHLRETVKDTCLKALQLEYEKSQRDDVERKLWRFAFYLPIGEFRSRLAAPTINEQLKAKTLVAYLKFLDDAVSYYQTLIAHLTKALDAAKSTTTISSSLSTLNNTTHKEDGDTISTLQSSLRTSLARCYICIGDLRRYFAAATANSTGGNGAASNNPTATPVVAAGPNKDSDRDKANDTVSLASPQSSLYSFARQAYAAAVGVDPTFGNAYNQLAVLDELEGNPLAAVFFYLRAQCALTPFPLGHQNVALLFGAAVTAENTAQAAATAAATGGGAVGGATSNKKARKEYFTAKKNTQQQRGSMPTPVLEKEIINKYLALSGCLYEKIDVDATPRHLSTAGAFLDELLNRIKQQTGSGGVAKCSRRVAQEFHSMPTSVQSAVEQRPVSLVMLITSVPLLLFQIFEDSSLNNSTSRLTPSGTFTASAAARGYTISYVLDISSRLLTTATKLRLSTKGPIGDAALSCPVFAAISVVLRWLVMRKAQPALGYERQIEENEDETMAAMVVEGEEEENTAGAVPPPPSSTPLSISISNVEKTVSGLNASRISFWKACTALCRLVPSSGVITVAVDEEEDNKVLLSEDYLLTGFTPLLKCVVTYEAGEQENKLKKEKAEEDPVAARALADALSVASTSSSNAHQWSVSDPGKPGELRARRIWQDLQNLTSYARAWVLHQDDYKMSSAMKDDAQLEELKEAVNDFIDAMAVSVGGPRAATKDNKNEQTPLVECAAAAAEEDEEEEDIVFAPVSAPRRSSSAALLNGNGSSGAGGGISGRSTPAPGAAPAAAAPLLGKAQRVDVGASSQRMDMESNEIAAAALHNNDDDGMGEEEDPQAAMERTGYAMAATVLSNDDAEIVVGEVHCLRPPPPPPPSSGLLGSLVFEGGGAIGGGYYADGGEAGRSLLMSSWQQHHPQPGAGGDAGFGGPPPFPSSALIGGAVAHQQQQEPAEGLRAVLFGGNMQQQHRQPPGGSHGGGGGDLWG